MRKPLRPHPSAPLCLVLGLLAALAPWNTWAHVSGGDASPVLLDTDSASRAPESLRPDPNVLGTFAWVSLDRMRQNAQVLTGEAPYQGSFIQSRHIYHPDHALAQAYLEEQLRRTGLEVEEEPFACGNETTCVNLIVELEGDTSPDIVWVVRATLSVGTT